MQPERTFVMPRPELGDVVLYYQDCEYGSPLPAVVTGVGVNSVQLAGLVPGVHGVLPVPNARHRDDPQLNNPDVHPDGAWEFTPRQREQASAREQALRLETAAARLAERVLQLENAVRAMDAAALKKKS